MLREGSTMKRRTLALLLCCAVLAGLLCACETEEPQSTPSAEPSAHQGEDPYEKLGYFTMTIAHAQPQGNPRSVSLAQFAQDMSAATHGHVTVEVVGDSQLGSEREMLEQCMAGTIQGMRGGQYDFSPRLMMFTLPFLTANRAQITALLHSDLAQSVCDEAGAATGTVILDLCDAGGYRQMSNNVRPIKSPEDLKGLKMRTNTMETTIMAFEAMGAETISIPYSDLYISLDTNVADGQDNPWINVDNMRFYEVQKYFTEVNYQFHVDPFYVNAQWFDSLPTQFQEILRTCADDMGAYNDRLIDEGTQTARDAIEASDAKLYIPTDQELDAFRAAMQPVYQQCIAQDICTAQELQTMQDIVAQAK